MKAVIQLQTLHLAQCYTSYSYAATLINSLHFCVYLLPDLYKLLCIYTLDTLVYCCVLLHGPGEMTFHSEVYKL